MLISYENLWRYLALQIMPLSLLAHVAWLFLKWISALFLQTIQLGDPLLNNSVALLRMHKEFRC